MILEAAILNVRPGQESAFVEAMRIARPLIAVTPGFETMELRQCVEVENRYLLLVEWRALEDHTVGFRQSARYQQWRDLLHHFYEPFPTVEHYEVPLELEPASGNASRNATAGAADSSRRKIHDIVSGAEAGMQKMSETKLESGRPIPTGRIAGATFLLAFVLVAGIRMSIYGWRWESDFIEISVVSALAAASIQAMVLWAICKVLEQSGGPRNSN